MRQHKFIPEMIANIEHNTGMTMEELRTLDHEEIDRRIEEKIGHPLKLGVEPGFQQLSRGDDSVLIEEGRTISHEQIESDFNKMFGNLRWRRFKTWFRGR